MFTPRAMGPGSDEFLGKASVPEEPFIPRKTLRAVAISVLADKRHM
jgi:hypothetical protein